MPEESKPEKPITSDNQLAVGSLVQVSGHISGWEDKQGIVVSTTATIEGSEHPIAVFFNLEYGRYEFSHLDIYYRQRGIMSIDDWDRQYQKACQLGEMNFLFENDAWSRCPRVIFFKPTEVTVIATWDIRNLAKRTFSNRFHSIALYPKTVDMTHPEHYGCRLKGCGKRASKLSLWNVWGSVYPIFTCADCYPKTHGFCADDLPALDETPIVPIEPDAVAV